MKHFLYGLVPTLLAIPAFAAVSVTDPASEAQLVTNQIASSDHYRRHGAPVNYSFYELAVGSQFGTDDDANPLKVRLASEGMMGSNWLIGFRLDGVLEEKARADRYEGRFTMSLARRFSVSDSIDLVTGAHGGYAFEYFDYDFYNEEFGEPVYGADVSLRYGVNSKLETALHYRGSYVWEELESIVAASVTYYPLTRLGLGLDLEYDVEKSAFATLFSVKF